MAVSEEILDRRRGIAVLRPGRKFVGFVLAGSVGVGLVAGGLYALHQSLADRILPGVSAAGVDLGGLTNDQARTALEARYGAIAKGGLLLRTTVGSTTIPFAEVGRAASIDAMVADAASRARGGSWLEETIAAIRLRLEPETIDLGMTYDHDKAAVLVDGFGQLMASQPVAASVIR